MKKASFIIGLIGGIVGTISCGALVFSGLNMKVTDSATNKVIAIGIVALLLQIAGLVGATITEKNKIVAGILMLAAGIFDIPASLFSISADNTITFLACAIVFILFIISGIMSLASKTQKAV